MMDEAIQSLQQIPTPNHAQRRAAERMRIAVRLRHCAGLERK